MCAWHTDLVCAAVAAGNASLWARAFVLCVMSVMPSTARLGTDFLSLAVLQGLKGLG